MSLFPPESGTGKEMANHAVGMLYESIPHPPAAYLGPEYSFRQSDGGNNNINLPNLGRAGARYARSVQGKTCIPQESLPDPGLMFDTLLRARNVRVFFPSQFAQFTGLTFSVLKRVDHKGGNSSLTFAFATLVTHSLFRTNLADWTINDTSSYLDLSPLYGHSMDPSSKFSHYC